MVQAFPEVGNLWFPTTGGRLPADSVKIPTRVELHAMLLLGVRRMLPRTGLDRRLSERLCWRRVVAITMLK